MRELKDLVRSLASINGRALDGLEAPDLSQISRQVEELRRLLNSDGAGIPSRNLLHQAIRSFVKEGRTRDFRETRLVSYGVIERIGNYRLIEDRHRFPKLLDCVDGYQDRFRAFRRCYRGLLGGYFGYDPEAEDSREGGRHNFDTLRTYLRERIRFIEGSGTTPQWVATLAAHENVLKEDPCARYAKVSLEGDRTEFEEVKAGLGISDASWMIRRLVLAQLRTATRAHDSIFKGYLPALLDLLEEHALLLNGGLAQILDRYSECRDLEVHPDLRDYAVQHWGNPWLPTNAPHWQLVQEPARQLVAGWLKLEFIHQFFNLLADDGASDRRRLQFWQRYYTHIDDMYFALGPAARNNHTREFVELRNKMEGRALELLFPGNYENNAFIMCIGEHVVVEFGKTGNACFIFRRDELPFELRGAVAGNSSALKHSNHIDRLLHHDRRWRRWEESFQRVISRLMHVQPAASHELPAGVGEASSRMMNRPPRPSVALHRTESIRESSTPASEGLDIPVLAPRAAEAQSDEGISLRRLMAYCENNGLSVRDLRGIGGNLWVTADDYPSHVTNQLLAWGFKFKSAKKGWWRSSLD